MQLARRLNGATVEGLLELVRHNYPDERVPPPVRDPSPGRRRRPPSPFGKGVEFL